MGADEQDLLFHEILLFFGGCTGLHVVSLFPPYHLFLSQNETFTSEIRTGTSTSGPITVANAAGDAIPKTAIATAIASSKLLDAAVNESEADFG